MLPDEEEIVSSPSLRELYGIRHHGKEDDEGPGVTPYQALRHVPRAGFPGQQEMFEIIRIQLLCIVLN